MLRQHTTITPAARRALTTAEIVAKKLDYKLKDIVADDRLYAGAVHDLLNHRIERKLCDGARRHVGDLAGEAMREFGQFGVMAKKHHALQLVADLVNDVRIL